MNSNTSETFLLARRRFILKTVSITSLLIGGLSLLVTVLNIIGVKVSAQTGQVQLGYLIVSLVCVLLPLLAYLLARRNDDKSIRLGAYFVTGMWTVVVTAIAAFNPSSISSFLVPVICAGLLFSFGEIIGWTIGLAVLVVVSYVLAANLTNPSGAATLGVFSVVSYVILLLIVGGGLWYLQVNIRTVLDQMNQKLNEMALLSQDREQKRQLGLEVGQNVRQQASTLTSVSLRQENGANEQVVAISEVTQAMEQLSESARYMAGNSEKALEVAERTQESATSVRAAASQAAQTTKEGLNESSETISAILRVQQQIVTLEKQLEELVNRSSQISGIVDLMRGLADQTHLLALNAAIESAGAGEAGERFGVVAAEVKQLADRSLVATRDVQQIVVELQQAIGQSSTVAVQARQESEQAAQRAQRSGTVIEELGRVITINSACADEILSEAGQASELMSRIAMITHTQQRATDQMTDTLRSMNQLVQENAGTTRQLNQAIFRLEVLSNELTEALNEAQRESEKEVGVEQLAA